MERTILEAVARADVAIHAALDALPLAVMVIGAIICMRRRGRG